jgi:hypothetical protein
MTYSRHKLASAPGAEDGTLHVRVVLDVHHRPKSTRNQDGVVVRRIHFRQFAASVQAVERLALNEFLLRRILLVIRIVRSPPTRGRSKLDRDAALVQDFIGMRDLRKKESGLAIVRADHRGVGDDKQYMLSHERAPSIQVKVWE